MGHRSWNIHPPGVRARISVAFVVAVALLAATASLAGARSDTPVSGAIHTSTDPAADGGNFCDNGNPKQTTPIVDCNLYQGKQYVWLDGGPKNKGDTILPAGEYFFAVLVPGTQPNPNDPTTSSANPGNLSCPTVGCADPVGNRTFTIGSDGKISTYTGTHQSDSTYSSTNGLMIRACLGTGGSFCPPYFDTTNPGGVYDMAVCYLGPVGGPLATSVTASSCKYDNFKVKSTTPPTCTVGIRGTDGSGFKYVIVTISSKSDLDTVQVVRKSNVTLSVPSDFGSPSRSGLYTLTGSTTTGPYTVRATRVVKTTTGHLTLTITDVFGNKTTCDPVLATLHARREGIRRLGTFKGLQRNEGIVRIANGRVGFSALEVFVNGRRYELTNLRSHSTRTLDVRAAMRPGAHNTIVVRGRGLPAARADIMISD